MTKLESAIEYFSKQNINPSGTLKKINAFEIAESSLKAIDSMLHTFREVQQDLISEHDALQKIYKALCNRN